MKARRITSANNDQKYSLKAKGVEGLAGIALAISRLDAERSFGWLLFEQMQGSSIGQDLYARTIQPDAIDWAILRGWLDHCDSRHKSSCAKADSVLLAGFRVIDCNTRSIVTAPQDCKFAALSYVWGTTTQTQTDISQDEIPSPAPLLIEDSIICTQAMGLQYLWIDRYCIDQAATETRHLLIQNMDKIYQGATVTIINAASEGADSGLPGVSFVARNPQEFLSIKDRKLIRIPYSGNEIRNSKWSTRGWTYQEGLLSRRRLIFTSEQVQFQCMEMHTCETMTAFFSSRPRPDWQENFLSDDLQVFPWGAANTFNDMNERISTYLKRELSYESDWLNAILGILNQFWKAAEPVYHFWGLPFHLGKLRSASLEKPLSNALLWLPAEDDEEKPLMKRQGFPSWSWTAWQNLTGIVVEEDDGYYLDNGVEVRIEDRDSNTITVNDYVRDMRLHWNIHLFSQRLIITGWVMWNRFAPVKDVNIEAMPSIGPRMQVQVLDATETMCISTATILTGLLAPDSTDILPILRDKWPILVFTTGSGRCSGLVLMPKANGSFQRFGVLQWGFWGSLTRVSGTKAYFGKYDWAASLRGITRQYGQTHCEWQTIVLE